ncbi:MAG: SDR family NAD(P)-dependent oxidoreductase [Azospirillaceae bacterium]|nr:SDR family NAD(P)-dependent oxidoreductase [Azospirillaceae bacterium]
MRLKNKVAIVTGGAQGIGLACVRAFADAGATVVLADIDEARGRAAAEAVETEVGRPVRFSRCDVGDRTAATVLADATAKAFGGIDILVNNAGITHVADFLDFDEADFDRVLRVNLKGAFLIGQAVARRMVARGQGGSIINLSSVNAVLAIPRQTAFVVSKGGLNQLTRVMALSLAPHAIRVNGIGPGSVMTDNMKAVMADEGARHTILSRTPMGRAGEPEEIAQIALFLASDESSYVTGQTIYADGGRLALNYSLPGTPPPRR